MSQHWFRAWAIQHARAFGMTDPDDVAMLNSWQEVFLASGYTEAELRAATAAMIAGDAPWRREHHLNLIQRHIRQSRDAARDAARADRRRHDRWAEACPHCGDSGWLVVPHPERMIDGVWTDPYWTAAVACECPRGARTRSVSEGIDYAVLTLEKYQLLVGLGWAEEMDRVTRLKLAEAAIARDARFLDDSKPLDVVKRLARKWAAPQE
jgi:hypothetical protein